MSEIEKSAQSTLGKANTPAEKRTDLLRAIPKVDEFLKWIPTRETDGIAELQIKNAIRTTLDQVRSEILSGKSISLNDLSREVLLAGCLKTLADKTMPNLRAVINATGVVIHTNLGRSLLPKEAMDAIAKVGARYSNLEFDLRTGKRGSRYSLVEELLCEITDAEAALVVNNNAAAVLLVLDTLSKGREVIVSRGQLVEIGGAFRIPDVMAKSGARLVEVGATNRTHLKDYEKAITENTSMLLKVHTSNFRIIGFTSEVSLDELVLLARERGLTIMEDLGSGSLLDLSKFGLMREPTVGEVVKAGVDVVTFSGDKLLGGPQGGLILGKKEVIDKIKRNPLTRAMRIDKFTLAGLEAVLRLYYSEKKALATVPTLIMLCMPYETICKKAELFLRKSEKCMAPYCRLAALDTESRVGGGAMPEEGLRSRAISVKPINITVNELERRLLETVPPVIGRIEEDHLILDMRTVLDEQIPVLGIALRGAFRVEQK